MKIPSLAALRRSSSGATAVEFAMVLPPLAMLLFGITEYGRYMWMRQAIYQTAIVGARCMGILQSSCSAGGSFNSDKTVLFIQATARGWGITIPGSGVTLSSNVNCSGVSGFSQVALNVTFYPIVPFYTLISSKGVPINVTACFPNNPTPP